MKVLCAFIGLLILGAFLALISALPVMWLWNWLVPSIFNLRQIDIFEAWGLCWLCAALFKTSASASS